MSVFITGGQAAELGPELLDNFADNDWATIIWACQTGNVPESWQAVEACQKPMTINGVDYPINIIGLGHDDYADGSGKAPITFQMLDCYGTTYAMNSTQTNVGGWTDCAMRNTHLPSIKALMPTEVQAAIRPVKKASGSNASSGTAVYTTSDELFLLDEPEIFGKISQSTDLGELAGSQYAYYANGGSKIKYNADGTASAWWQRSPYKSNATHFCRTTTTGLAGTGSASAKAYVAFAFCF